MNFPQMAQTKKPQNKQKPKTKKKKVFMAHRNSQ